MSQSDGAQINGGFSPAAIVHSRKKPLIYLGVMFHLMKQGILGEVADGNLSWILFSFFLTFIGGLR